MRSSSFTWTSQLSDRLTPTLAGNLSPNPRHSDCQAIMTTMTQMKCFQ